MEGITGRDEYIIAQALLCAIRFIDNLPSEQQPLSNQTDMKVLLDHLTPDPRALEFIDDGWLRVTLLDGQQRGGKRK